MWLFDWTKKEGLSDADLARELGMGRVETVRRWRKKKFKPCDEYQRKIFSLSNGLVTPNDFFSEVQ